jgi:hypothetical protein
MRRPDLEDIWSYATITPLERPDRVREQEAAEAAVKGMPQ